jgi:hypothetical protein
MTYVEDQYLPEGFTFKEPSKLSKSEVYKHLKFWYGRQQDGGAETVFKFRCIKGKDGEPEEVAMEEETSKARKKKKPVQKQGPKGKGKGKGRQEETQSDEDPSKDKVPKQPLKKAGRKAPKSQPKPQEEIEESSSSSSESPSASDDEENEEDQVETPRGQFHPASEQLPFGPVPRKLTAGPSGMRKLIAGPSSKRYNPATGPQYEKPNTRRRALNAVEEGSPAKKRRTDADEIVKVGPPRGVKKNMPTASMKGKGNGKK